MPCPICPGCEGAYPGPARSGITLQREDAVIADKRYYVNADRSKVVDESDPEATYLLAAEGADISNEDVERYGLGKKKAADPEPMVVQSTAADPVKEDAPAQSKAMTVPPENKARATAKKDDEDK